MIERFLVDEEGQGLMEYVMILFFVAVVVIIALTVFGLDLKNFYNETVNGVTSPMGG